eukprot:gnl/Chilomastix_cuspidata/804.p1 GENE.gnl/Chilomastix_cuspidata/804~~gnl/Chilomastix_cuspidata/804.p1  ORF type:complete len:2617 (-),score=647.94 gnl/Chilomastix_cuspidata/804:19-7869(-)
MARTRQTARKFAGSKVPRKQLALKAAVKFPPKARKSAHSSNFPLFSKKVQVKEESSFNTSSNSWSSTENSVSWTRILKSGFIFRKDEFFTYRLPDNSGWGLGQVVEPVPVPMNSLGEIVTDNIPKSFPAFIFEERHVDTVPRFRFFQTEETRPVMIEELLCPVNALRCGSVEINGILMHPDSEVATARAFSRSPGFAHEFIVSTMCPHLVKGAATQSQQRRFTRRLAFTAPLMHLPSDARLVKKLTASDMPPGKSRKSPIPVKDQWHRACDHKFREDSSDVFDFLLQNKSYYPIPAFVFKKVAKREAEDSDHVQLKQLYNLQEEFALKTIANHQSVLRELSNIPFEMLNSPNVAESVGIYCYHLGKALHATSEEKHSSFRPKKKIGNNPYTRRTGEGEHLEHWVQALGQPLLLNFPLARAVIRLAMKEAKIQCDLGWMHLVALTPGSEFPVAPDGETLVLDNKTIRKNSFTKISYTALRVTPLHFAAINPDHRMLLTFQRTLGELPCVVDSNDKSPFRWCLENKQDLEKNFEIFASRGGESWYGISPMGVAAIRGHIKILSVLKANCPTVLNGVDISSFKHPQFESLTPMHIAALCGKINVLRFLIAMGIRPTARTKMFNTSCSSFNECMKRPFNNQPDFRDAGLAPIHMATISGSLPAVRYLALEARAPIIIGTLNKTTPLHLAAQFGHGDIVSFLLHHGANYDTVNSLNETPLHFAVRGGHHNVVKYLLKCGADVTVTDSDGMTPLWHAIIHGHKRIVKMFLKTGKCSIDSKNNDGMTIVSYLLRKTCNNIFDKKLFDTLTELIEVHKCPVTPRDKTGLTALHHFVMTNPEILTDSSSRTRSFGMYNRNNFSRVYWTRDSILRRMNFLELIVKAGEGETCYFSRREQSDADSEEPTTLSDGSSSTNNQIHSPFYVALNNNLQNTVDVALGLIKLGVLDQFKAEIERCVEEGNETGGFYAEELATTLFTIFDNSGNLLSNSINEVVMNILDVLIETNVIGSFTKGGHNLFHFITSSTLPMLFARTPLTGKAPKDSSIARNSGDLRKLMMLLHKAITPKTVATNLFKKLLKPLWDTRIRDETEEVQENTKQEQREEEAHMVPSTNIPSTKKILLDLNLVKQRDTSVREVNNSVGNTVLHILATQSNKKYVEFIGSLLIKELKRLEQTQYTEFINARNAQGYSALGLSLLMSCTDATNFILSLDGIDHLIETREPTCFSILETLVSSNRLELLSHLTSFLSKTELEELLRFRNHTGSTVFHSAANKSHVDLRPLMTLVDVSEPIPNLFEEMLRVEDDYKVTPIHLLFFNLSQKRFNESVPDMVEAFELDTQDEYGRTPIHYLFSQSPWNPVMAKSLKRELKHQKKSVPGSNNTDGHDPALVISVILNICGEERVVKALLMKDRWNRTPLHYAAIRGSSTSAVLLSKLRPELLESVDIDQNTPLALAMQHSQKDTALSLFQTGSDPRTIIYPAKIHTVESDTPREEMDEEASDREDGAPSDQSLVMSRHNQPLYSVLASALSQKIEGLSLLLSTAAPKKDALAAAIQAGNVAFVDFLLKAGTQELSGIVETAGPCGWHLSHFIFASIGMLGSAFERIASELLERGVNFSAGAAGGVTPLHALCVNELPRALSWLFSTHDQGQVEHMLLEKDTFDVTPMHQVFLSWDLHSSGGGVSFSQSALTGIIKKSRRCLAWIPKQETGLLPKEQEKRLLALKIKKRPNGRFGLRRGRNATKPLLAPPHPDDTAVFSVIEEEMFATGAPHLGAYTKYQKGISCPPNLDPKILFTVAPTSVQIPETERRLSILCQALQSGGSRALLNILLVAQYHGIIQELLDERDKHGRTPLFLTLVHKDFNSMSMLMVAAKRAGAKFDPTVADENGETLLELALDIGKDSVLLSENTLFLEALFVLQREGLLSTPLPFGDLADPNSIAARVAIIGGKNLDLLIENGVVSEAQVEERLEAFFAPLAEKAAALSAPLELVNEADVAGKEFLQQQTRRLEGFIKQKDEDTSTSRKQAIEKVFEQTISGKQVKYHVYGIKTVVTIAASGCQNSFYDMALWQNSATGAFTLAVSWGQLDMSYASSTSYSHATKEGALKQWNKTFEKKFGYSWLEVATDLKKISDEPVKYKFRYLNTDITDETLQPNHPNVRRLALASTRRLFRVVLDAAVRVYGYTFPEISSAVTSRYSHGTQFLKQTRRKVAPTFVKDKYKPRVFTEMTRQVWETLEIEPSSLPVETQILVARLAYNSMSPRIEFSAPRTSLAVRGSRLLFNAEFEALENITAERMVEARRLLDEISEVAARFNKVQKRMLHTKKEEKRTELAVTMEREAYTLTDLSSRYFMAAPNTSPLETHPFFLKNENIISKENDRLDILSKANAISQKLFGAVGLALTKRQNPIDTLYTLIGCTLTYVPRVVGASTNANPLFDAFSDWASASGKTLSHLFEIVHEDTARFDFKGSRRLLLHGTFTGNSLGIMTEGMRIRAPDSIGCGKRLGFGIYAADTVNKALRFGSGAIGDMIYVVEYTMKAPLEITQSEHYRALSTVENGAPKDHDSVILYGRQVTNEAEYKTLRGHTLMPCTACVEHPSVAEKDALMEVDHSEFAVYDEKQCRLRYVMIVK